MPDLYAALGVARDIDEDALRKAYRKLARENHPDLRPDDDAAEERFKQVSRAYSVLSDPGKRELYDQFGEASLEAGFDAEAAHQAREAFGGFAGRGDGFRTGFSFDELLGGLFGRFDDPRRTSRAGPDLHAALNLDFLDATRGSEQRVQIARPTASGEIKHEKLTVRIPPGIRDGGRIRLEGKGGESPDGPPGDLFLDVRVRPHPVFRREGQDLYLDLPITVREATLGAGVAVPTLDGRATVTVPAATQGGNKLRLRGKGIPGRDGRPAGDLIVTLRIRIPSDLDAEALRGLDAFSAGDEDPRGTLFL